MSKRRAKKGKEQIVKKECPAISEERLIEIYAEAYYRALKRIDQEREATQEQITNKKKIKLITKVLFILNLIFFPLKISKHFEINKRMYDGILIVIISVGLMSIGFLTWIVGLCKFVCDIILLISDRSLMLFLTLIIDLVFSFYGSFIYLAGKSFGEETESNRVYAYSASILALVSCVVSLIALLKR